VHRPEELLNNQSGNEAPRLMQVWSQKVRSEKDFCVGRDGDSLITPFECDRCIFIKLRGSLPNTEVPSDQLLTACIRRMNLDLFWSRETSTVLGNLAKTKRMIKMCSTVGLPGPFTVDPPFPLHDHCGYQVAIAMLLFSRKPGQHDKTYTQYETIRGYRSCYSNFVRASSSNTSITRSLGDSSGNYQRFSEDECASLFFKRFTEGLRSRMGQLVKPNLALGLPLLKKLIHKLEMKYLNEEDRKDKHILMVIIAYIVVSYVLSLRGPEGLLLDLGGLKKHLHHSREYLVIPLLGRLKGENHDLLHLIPCSPETSSGINIAGVLDRLLSIKVGLNFLDGPAISDDKGNLLSPKLIDDVIHEALEEIFVIDRTLFPLSVESIEKIKTSYQCFRFFRRTSATIATEQGVSSTDTNVVNRWRTEENARGKQSNLGMHQHYTQLELLVEPFLRYTRAM